MPRVLVVSPTGHCVLRTMEEQDFAKYLKVQKLHQHPEISKHAFRHQYASRTLGLKKDVHYYSHTLLDIHPDPLCTLPLHPLRQHVLNWSLYYAQKEPQRNEKADNFRGPIIITKEYHIPLPGDVRVNFDHIPLPRNIRASFDRIRNHDCKPEVVDMTETDVKLIMEELDPIYERGSCVVS